MLSLLHHASFSRKDCKNHIRFQRAHLRITVDMDQQRFQIFPVDLVFDAVVQKNMLYGQMIQKIGFLCIFFLVSLDGLFQMFQQVDYDFDDLLSSIYDNEIFVLYLSDYGITLEP